jgi:hypothetical protein
VTARIASLLASQVDEVDKLAGSIERGGLYTIIAILLITIVYLHITKERQAKRILDLVEKHAGVLADQRTASERVAAVLERQAASSERVADLLTRVDRRLERSEP